MNNVIEQRAATWHPFGRGYLSRCYTILFYTLLFTMVAAPVLTALEFTGALIELLLAASLVAAVMPVRSGASRWGLLIVTVLVWLAREVTGWFQHPALSAMTLGLWTVVALFAAAPFGIWRRSGLGAVRDSAPFAGAVRSLRRLQAPFVVCAVRSLRRS